MKIDLTRRQREIVAAILDGCSNREVAARLGVTERTVKNHLTAIYARYGVANRLQLALAARRRDGFSG